MTLTKTPKVSRYAGGKRLLRLANALEKATTAGKYQLVMSRWVGPRNAEPIRKHCGTAGCAVGYCPMIFKSVKYRKVTRIEPVYSVKFPGSADTMAGAQHFFGLTGWEGYQLFAPSSYPATKPFDFDPSPATVVKRIRSLAAKMIRRKPKAKK